MRTMIAAVLILILWGAAPGLAQLPPEIQVDSYLLRAEQALAEGDPTRAWAEIDKILDLQKEHELDLPEEFHFRYAKAAGAAGLPEQAHEAVVKYLTLAGREGRHYEAALKLMNQAQDAIEGDKGPQAASNEPSPPAQAAEQGEVEAQVDAGGSPKVQSAQPELDIKPKLPDVLARHSRTATRAADCKKWKKERFWKTATDVDVSACLDAGADPSTPGKSKITPLHWAAKHSPNPDVIEKLIAAGAVPNVLDKWKATPLHRAARYNENPAVVKALIAAGSSLEARSDTQNTPLHTAARFNSNPEVIKTLLAAGASLGVRNQWGYTPLHRAAQSNEHPEIIKALVAAGASLEARDEWEYTPLHRAAVLNNNPEIIRVLVDAGADPNARNHKGKRPMDLTKKKADRRILAAAGGRRTPKSSGGGGLGALIAGVAVGTALGAAGASDEEALAAGTVLAEQVRSGQPSTGDGGIAGVAGGSMSVGGSCEIPGYPSPPGGVANVGLPWCPANVGLQVRAFALQAAGAQCALAVGSSSTPEQIQARRREIVVACGRLAELGAANCRCPARLGGAGHTEDYGAIERANQRREQQAKQQKEARLASEREREALQAEEARQAVASRQIEINRRNATILSGNCSCIRIHDDGEYTCMDGFVVGNNSSGKPLCDIKR